MKREFYKSLRTISHEEPLGPGGPLCAGCGGQLNLRLFHKAFGENVVFVNAAGCSTLLATYPLTPLNSSWIYTAMACAPAGAQGVRDALDILKEKGKLPPEQDRKVVVLTGDGAAQDIGLSSTMAAIHRGLDFYYLCYDNESYGNTGFQTSASTPYGSRTATCPITPSSPHGLLHEKRDLFEIWRVQRPPYLATVSPAYPLDLSEKIYRAGKFKGPKLFIALTPCPPGWEFDPEWSVEIARLAVESGIWPLKEAIHGEVAHTHIPRKFAPVENYLARQGRFRHLFEPKRDEETIAHIQATVDHYWKETDKGSGNATQTGPTQTKGAVMKEQPTCCGTGPAVDAEEQKERVTIEFLYLDLRECGRCKGTNKQLESALPIITQALEASGFEVELRKIHVQSVQQATALGFVVSPTIRVDNRDIQFNWRESPCEPCSKGCASKVSCREWKYRGRWHEVPPKELMIRGILREVYGRAERAAPEAHGTTEVPDNLKRFFSKQSCCGASA